MDVAASRFDFDWSDACGVDFDSDSGDASTKTCYSTNIEPTQVTSSNTFRPKRKWLMTCSSRSLDSGNQLPILPVCATIPGSFSLLPLSLRAAPRLEL